MSRGTATRPAFSVVVPCFNQGRFLATALDSLQCQTWQDWEAVVVDDGSDDETGEVAARFSARDERIVVVRRPNGGAAAALNTGIARARHEWICWLSADDWYLPLRLQAAADAINSDPSSRFFYSQYLIHEESSGRRFGPCPNAACLPSPATQTLAFFTGNFVNGITTTIHRSLLQDGPPFNTALRHAQDVEAWIRLSLRTPFRFLPEPLAVQRSHAAMGSRVDQHLGLMESALALGVVAAVVPFDGLVPFAQRENHADATSVVRAIAAAVVNPAAYQFCGLGYPPILLQALRRRPTGHGNADGPWPDFQALHHDLGRTGAPEWVKQPLVERPPDSLDTDLAARFRRQAPEPDIWPSLDERRAAAVFIGAADFDRRLDITRQRFRPAGLPEGERTTLPRIGTAPRLATALGCAAADDADAWLERIASRPLFVWGAGRLGRGIAHLFGGCNLQGFVDSAPAERGALVEGRRRWSPGEFEPMLRGERRPFVVVASGFSQEIEWQLEAMGCRAGVDYASVS